MNSNYLSFFIFLCLGFSATSAPTQESHVKLLLRAKNSIQVEPIMQQIRDLCDPKLLGREAGYAGARESANYIANKLKTMGIHAGGNAGSYYQTFKIRAGYRIQSDLEWTLENESFKHAKRKRDYMPIHIPGGRCNLELDLVLAGYGIHAPSFGFNEYQDIIVKNKAVLVFAGTPWKQETQTWLQEIDSTPYHQLSYKAKLAYEKGAKLLIVVDNPSGWRRRIGLREHLSLPDTTFPILSKIPIIHITKKLASQLTGLSIRELRMLALDITQKKVSLSKLNIKTKLSFRASIKGQSRIGKNVIGILPGSDPKLRKEAIVIGAHYDHLGEDADGIYYGANDNASGVSALLEIARAFTRLAEAPKRSLVFTFFAAEEIGKLGSAYYVAHPSLPIEQTILMINMDMIGRNHPNEVNIYGTRSSPELHRIHQEVNQWVGLKILEHSGFRLYSDHKAFYNAGVPVMYLFAGRHTGYHTPDDTVDKLIPEKIVKIAQLAFLTAWKVSGFKERIYYSE